MSKIAGGTRFGCRSILGQFRFDDHQRIARCEGPTFSFQWEFYPRVRLTVTRPESSGEVAIIPYVMISDPSGQFFDELVCLSNIERRTYLKSEWFSARMPADVWKYVINGSIYDPRSQKGVDKRFKCQQCAYAWWSYFGFLYKESNKKIYDIMQDEIAYSVFLDMSQKGGFGHGFWSDEIETHARFHLDGVHLLISQYEKTGSAFVVRSGGARYSLCLRASYGGTG